MFFREHPRKRRINMCKEKDYEYLLHAFRIREEIGFINLDEWDILQLKCGEAVFLYESPLAASAEEAETMMRQAAKKMAPKTGRVVLLSMVQIIASYDMKLDAIEAAIHQLPEPFREKMIFGTRFCDAHKQKGIRFVMAAAEGKHGSNPFCMDCSLETPALGKSEDSDGGAIEM